MIRTATRAIVCICFFTAGIAHAQESRIVLNRAKLWDQAKREASTAVHPGAPGQQPFWNGHARKFTYAPSFDFAAVDGATSYRFSAHSGADFETYVFSAEIPWADLGPIWQKLPVGMVDLTVDAIKGEEVLKEAGHRRFYKDSPFRGPHRTPVVDYRQSARRLLEYTFKQPYIQHWLETGKPDPDLGHYSYPSKVIGAVIEAMALAIREDMPFKKDAQTTAQKAAAYLIETSLPADSPYAYFPLTYDLTQTKTPVDAAKKYNGQLMLFYPAEVGLQYLDLYKITKDAILLEAAKRIADTYVRTQLPCGTWPIKVTIDDGKAMGDPLCIPVHIIRFLNALVAKHGMKQYEKPCQAAFDWTMNNPVRTFNWEGQFEDIHQDKPPYENLSARAAALYFAIYLSENYANDPPKMQIVRDLLRFSEDQFMVWERPAPTFQPGLFDLNPGHGELDSGGIYDPSTWMTPVTLEQYNYYVPIGTSGSVTLEAYLSAWKTGGSELDLAKAISFGNNMTYLQQLHGEGGIPTHWTGTHRGCYGWINNLASQARALLAAADALEGKSIIIVDGARQTCSHTVAGLPCPFSGTGSQCPYTGNGLVGSKPASKRAN